MAQQPTQPGQHLATARELLERLGLGPGGPLGGEAEARVTAAVAHSVLAVAEQIGMLRQELVGIRQRVEAIEGHMAANRAREQYIKR